jgi:hypothetical protein
VVSADVSSIWDGMFMMLALVLANMKQLSAIVMTTTNAEKQVIRKFGSTSKEGEFANAIGNGKHEVPETL